MWQTVTVLLCSGWGSSLLPILEPPLERLGMAQMAGTRRAGVAGAKSRITSSFLYLAPGEEAWEAGLSQDCGSRCPHVAFPARQPQRSQTSHVGTLCNGERWPPMASLWKSGVITSTLSIGHKLTQMQGEQTQTLLSLGGGSQSFRPCFQATTTS